MLGLSNCTQTYPILGSSDQNVPRTHHIETCSEFMIPEAGVAGRTLDFPYPMITNLVRYPINEQLSSTDPDGNKSVEWNSKYGIVGLAAFGKENDKGNVIEGLNTQGLTFSSLTLEATKYQGVPINKMDKALALSDLPLYLLGTCANIDEVKAALAEVFVWGDNIPPIGIYLCHLIFHDADMKSLVVEYIDGELKMVEGVRVLTNDPPLPQQLENLQKYQDLNTGYAPGSTYPGTGMIGLPGDYSTQSRFVRLSILLKNLKIEKGCEIKVALQILSSVVVPNGIKLAFPDNVEIYDRTHWMTITNIATLQMYYQTATDNKWYTADLNVLDFNGTERTSIRIYHPLENRIPNDSWAISVNDKLVQESKKKQEEKSTRRWWNIPFA